MIRQNPLFQESLKLSIGDDGAVRRYIIFISVIGALTLLAWPREHFLYFIEPRRAPAVYMITLITSFFLSTFFISEFAIEFVGREEFYRLSEWFRLSPVPLRQIFIGKAEFALLHTVFIFMLPMPFVIMAAAVGGITAYQLAAALLIILVVLLAYRFLGLFMITLVERGRVGINFLLKALIVLSLLLTPKYAPALNPIVALLQLQSEGQPPAVFASPPEYFLTGAIYLASAVFFGIGTMIVVLMRGRKYRNVT